MNKNAARYYPRKLKEFEPLSMGWDFRVLTTALLSSDVKYLVCIFILNSPNPTLRSGMTEKKTNSIQSPGWCRAHFKVVTYANYTVS